MGCQADQCNKIFFANSGKRQNQKYVNFVCLVNKNYQKLLQKNTKKQKIPMKIKTLRSMKQELLKKT